MEAQRNLFCKGNGKKETRFADMIVKKKCKFCIFRAEFTKKKLKRRSKIRQKKLCTNIDTVNSAHVYTVQKMIRNDSFRSLIEKGVVQRFCYLTTSGSLGIQPLPWTNFSLETKKCCFYRT